MPSLSLDVGDAAELGEMLQFLSGWLAADRLVLGLSLARLLAATPTTSVSYGLTLIGSRSCSTAMAESHSSTQASPSTSHPMWPPGVVETVCWVLAASGAVLRRRCRRRVLRHYSLLPSRYRCRPSPCAGLSPARSTTAAPPRLDVQWSVRLSQPAGWEPAAGNHDQAVPVFTVVRSAEEEPGCVPAASPRVRRRPSPWPPGGR